MNYLSFKQSLQNYIIFNLKDIRKIDVKFDLRRLNEWKNKNYIKMIRDGHYIFSDIEINKKIIFLIANKIYSHSYVSLESALSYYNLIPEEVFQITSVSTKKTNNFETLIGDFNYRHIKPSLYFGYKLLEFEKRNILIAEPEKALLDYFYLNAQLQTADDFREIRINDDEFVNQINKRKFNKYLKAYKTNSLTKRVKIFLNIIQND